MTLGLKNSPATSARTIADRPENSPSVLPAKSNEIEVVAVETPGAATITLSLPTSSGRTATLTSSLPLPSLSEANNFSDATLASGKSISFIAPAVGAVESDPDSPTKLWAEFAANMKVYVEPTLTFFAQVAPSITPIVWITKLAEKAAPLIAKLRDLPAEPVVATAKPAEETKTAASLPDGALATTMATVPSGAPSTGAGILDANFFSSSGTSGSTDPVEGAAGIDSLSMVDKAETTLEKTPLLVSVGMIKSLLSWGRSFLLSQALLARIDEALTGEQRETAREEYDKSIGKA